MPEIEWDTPPEAKGGRTSKYEYFYEGLKDDPGEWAKYPGSVGGATGYAKRNPDYEVTTRILNKDGDEQQFAWMRYVPQEDHQTQDA